MQAHTATPRPPRLRRRTSALPLLPAIVIAAACGREPARTRVAHAGAGEGGTVVVAIPNDLQDMNPLVAEEAYSSELLRYALFLPLVEYGPKLEVRPRLAERWELLGDTGVVFHLRRGVRWSDGVPVT
ncbi:MAG TPA: hypothetical protein VFQ38_11260, partial [Longimicrobiales bacterium]|nr:hypothetical protein [Longimicrobiales bacterium]